MRGEQFIYIYIEIYRAGSLSRDRESATTMNGTRRARARMRTTCIPLVCALKLCSESSSSGLYVIRGRGRFSKLRPLVRRVGG